MDCKNMGFATRQIHAGKHDNGVGALCTPIYQTSTFEFDTVQQGGARFAGQEEGYIYSRLGNPSLTQVEEKLAALEGGEAALATASGMGAISSALWSSVEAGDEIVASDTLYGCTFALLNHGMSKFGVGVKFVDFADLAAVKAALTEKTKVVYLETPCNPTLKVVDIAEVAKIAHEFNKDIRVIVDNTFCSPYIQQPLSLGADVVVHSATKYINGHGDALGGVVVGSAADMGLIRGNAMTKINGCPPSPFNSYLVLRGMKTLALRIERHCQNAMAVAKYLESNPYVKKVYYPGLESDPSHELACRQMENGLFGGILSFELNDDVKGMTSFEAGKKLLNNLSIASIAVSLGDPDTLIEHPASMTHAAVSKEDRLAAGITDGLIRLSVGLESARDLINDFETAFAAI